MKTTLIALILLLVSACSKREPVEEFQAGQCTYEATSETSSYTYQTGCAMYGTDSKGMSNGVCLAPMYAEQKQRAVNISCTKKVWKDL